MGRIQVKMRQLYEIMKSQNEKGARDKRQIEEIVGSISPPPGEDACRESADVP